MSARFRRADDTKPDGAYARLGIFARTFRRPTAAAVAEAVAAAGFDLTQLNLSAFGLPTIPPPDQRHTVDPRAIRAAFARSNVRIWGVSATYNTVHPDRTRRMGETAAAVSFIPIAAAIGAEVVTLCSGTRDPDDMWSGHPANADVSAWHDLRETLDQLLPAAEATGVRLGIEPEPANVIRDAATARRLVDELGRDADLVGIVLDPANLLDPGTLQDPATAKDQADILTAAFEDLGPVVVGVHAKDVVAAGYAAAGMGVLDYDLVFALHAGLPADVPVVIQDAVEHDVARTRDYLIAHARRHPRPMA